MKIYDKSTTYSTPNPRVARIGEKQRKFCQRNHKELTRSEKIQNTKQRKIRVRVEYNHTPA